MPEANGDSDPRPIFFDGSRQAAGELRATVSALLDTLEATHRTEPFTKLSPGAIAGLIGRIDPLPEDGVPLGALLAEIGETIMANGVRVDSPNTAAHLHPPTLITAAAAELAIGATNQSMDSFDQAPAATHAEDRLVRRLGELLGLPPASSGVLTAGGTSSNLLGLLLAREHACGSITSGRPGNTSTGMRASWDVAGPAERDRTTIVASEAAHVSVRQAAFVLGLGREAVVPVETDDAGRMDVAALDAVLDRVGGNVMAIVGTAGTTDAGAIDPLDALAERSRRFGCWFHVDAAVGAGLALSDELRPLLTGLECADSITADLHKLWWQPISASALLVRDGASFEGLREPADYLNRPGDDVLNLVDRSLDTSRRFDALKVLISLRSVGRRRLGELVEHIVDLARHAAEVIRDRPDMELLREPQTVTVLFRARPYGAGGRHRPWDDVRRANDPAVAGETGEAPAHGASAGDLDTWLDELNTTVQRELLATGQAVVGRTRVDGRVVLKLTLVNPLVTRQDLTELIELIASRGKDA